MKLSELIIKLQKLEEEGYGGSKVYYEAEEQYGDVEKINIEGALEDDWLPEIYLS